MNKIKLFIISLFLLIPFIVKADSSSFFIFCIIKMTLMAQRYEEFVRKKKENISFYLERLVL